jgi:hypothetical protein
MAGRASGSFTSACCDWNTRGAPQLGQTKRAPATGNDNKITKFGIEAAGVTLRWEVLSHFYFTTRFNYVVLTVVTHAPYNFHSYMIIPDDNIRKQVMRILAEHIVYQEKPVLTFTDRMIHFLSYLIPDDEETTTSKEVKKAPEDKLTDIKDTLESFFQKPKSPSPSHP